MSMVANSICGRGWIILPSEYVVIDNLRLTGSTGVKVHKRSLCHL